MAASESNLDTSNLDSLPAVIESVSLAQRLQSNELVRHQNALKELEVQLEEVVDKVNASRKEISETEKRHFCQQEEMLETTTSCETLKKVIFDLLEEDFQLKTKLDAIQQKLITDKSVHYKYFESMANHEALAVELEETCPIQMALVKQQELVLQLQTEKEQLESSVEEVSSSLGKDPMSKIKDELCRLKKSKNELETEITAKEKQLQEESQHQSCLLQDISVLKKRNHAQLLRLRNQVKEAQMRNHQWHEQACQLEKQISELQKVITEKES